MLNVGCWLLAVDGDPSRLVQEYKLNGKSDQSSLTPFNELSETSVTGWMCVMASLDLRVQGPRR